MGLCLDGKTGGARSNGVPVPMDIARDAVEVVEYARLRLFVSGASKAVKTLLLRLDLMERVGDGGGET